MPSPADFVDGFRAQVDRWSGDGNIVFVESRLRATRRRLWCSGAAEALIRGTTGGRDAHRVRL